MKAQIIANLVSVLLSMLSPEMLKKFADIVLDFAEDYVEKSPNKYDDMVIKPLCATIRSTFDIPDED